MEDSILTSIKKILGISESYEVFDSDIITHINSVFSIMNQIGATPPGGFTIEDKNATWSDFLADKKNLDLVRSYMALRVRKLFDPPATSFGIDAIEQSAKEYEWRLSALELVFSGGSSGGEAYIWDLTGLSDFPADAPVGAIGVDFVTGDVWRKS